MSRFTVILPEGTVILKNEETGQILRLSAESGPLVLGEIEMSMTPGPRPLEVAGAAFLTEYYLLGLSNSPVLAGESTIDFRSAEFCFYIIQHTSFHQSDLSALIVPA